VRHLVGRLEGFLINVRDRALVPTFARFYSEMA
jgi:hypothetical protein